MYVARITPYTSSHMQHTYKRTSVAESGGGGQIRPLISCIGTELSFSGWDARRHHSVSRRAVFRASSFVHFADSGRISSALHDRLP